jgi:putative transposase
MRKQYTAAFKAKVVIEVLREEKTVSQIGSESGVHPNQISQWKSAVLKGLPDLFEKERSGKREKEEHEKQLNELYAEIGKLTTQLAWLKKKSGIDFL